MVALSESDAVTDTPEAPAFDAALLALAERIIRRKSRAGMQDRAAMQIRKLAALFVEATGVSDVTRLRQADCARFRDTLAELPVDYTYDGRPLSAATKPGILSSLQDLTAEIMGRHCPGIERGRRYGKRLAAGAEFRDILHRSVKRLHQDLPHELAEMEARLEAKREAAYGLAAGILAMKAKIEDARAVVDDLTP